MNKAPTYRLPVSSYHVPIEKLERDIYVLRQRYGKGLGRRPTKEELAAMRRAAALTIASDFALTDPAASANDVVRLTNAAARARSAMEALLEAGNRSPVRKTFDDLLAEHAS